MNKNFRNKIFCLITLIILCFFKSLFFNKFNIIYNSINILFVFFIFSSINLGYKISYKYGFLIGIILDFFAHSLGYYSMIYTLLGFIIGKFKGKIFQDYFLSPLILILLSTFLYNFLQILILLIFLNFNYINFFKNSIIELGFNLIFAIPINFIFMHFKISNMTGSNNAQ